MAGLSAETVALVERKPTAVEAFKTTSILERAQIKKRLLPLVGEDENTLLLVVMVVGAFKFAGAPAPKVEDIVNTPTGVLDTLFEAEDEAEDPQDGDFR